MSFKDYFGETVRNARTEMNLSQEKLAEKIGKSTGLIGQIERGETEPSFSSFCDLVLTLNLDANKILNENDTIKSDSYTNSLKILIERMTPNQTFLLYKIALLIYDFPLNDNTEEN